jgi:predicted site-specific integrase-resolvase
MINLLSVKEFAQRINKSEETVKRWIRSGKIPNARKESDKKGWRSLKLI